MPADDTKVKPSKLHQAARAFAAAGVKVFPCVPGEKRPISKHGFYEATTDLKQIDKWWTENPDANIATSPHLQGQGVVDLDGKIGIENWEFLGLMHDTPETYVVRTPRGGQHWYYRGELHASASKIEKKIDTRGVGSYVLLPPSVTADGEYTVLHDRPIAELPAWIAEAARKHREHKKAAAGTKLDTSRNIEAARRFLKGRVARGVVAIEGEGGHDHTYQTACEVLDHGLSPEKAHELLLAEWNEHCRPPWDEGELETIIGNAARYQQNEPGSKAPGESPEHWKDSVAKMKADDDALEFTVMDDTVDEIDAVPWFWYQRFPAWMLSLISGHPDQGKTTVALDIAARASRGEPWPDAQTNKALPGDEVRNGPMGVLWIADESSRQFEISPRFLATGGDPSRFVFLNGRARMVENDDGQQVKRIGRINLKDHLEWLTGVIRKIEAQRGIKIELIMIDPLNSYLGDTDTFKNSDVREVLEPFAKWADEQRVTVFGITHLGKSRGGRALAKVLDSTAIVAVARAIYTIGADPDADPNDKRGEARLFVRSKGNLGPKIDGLRYRFSKEMVIDPKTGKPKIAPRTGRALEASRITWDTEPVRTSADEMLHAQDNPGRDRPISKQRAIAEDLEALLKDKGWQRAATIFGQLVGLRHPVTHERASILTRARADARVISDQMGGRHWWCLEDEKGGGLKAEKGHIPQPDNDDSIEVAVAANDEW